MGTYIQLKNERKKYLSALNLKVNHLQAGVRSMNRTVDRLRKRTTVLDAKAGDQIVNAHIIVQKAYNEMTTAASDFIGIVSV